ncbi:MAG TPA: SRPBCC family protein [Gemmatimonadaceae bacterium]|nr:SRPBCC family protein [Gemmatimonadaceae bacterium]
MAHPVDVTTPSDRQIRVTRGFDAPRTLIFDCHTRPELVKRWLLGPPGWTMPVCEIDLRVGGHYRYVWRNDENGREFTIGGEHREIVAPARIVTLERFEEDEALCTLTLTEHDGRTTLTQTMEFATRELRDKALQTGMTDGMAISYDRLEALAEEVAGV